MKPPDKIEVPMDCQEFKNEMMDWVLDELPAETRGTLEQHAAGCVECKTRWSRLRQTKEILQRSWRDEEVPTPIVFTPAATAPSGFWAWLLAAPRWVNASMATAAAVVLLFGVLSLTRTEVRVDQGRFLLAFGHSVAVVPATPSAVAGQAASVTLPASEVEKIVSAKYASLSARDQQQFSAMLDQWSQQWRIQRVDDLQRIGESFDQVKTVMWKEMQRNNAIVQYAAQRIATSSKN